MKKSPSPTLFLSVLAIWAALALTAIASGLFRAEPGEPSLALALQLLGVGILFLAGIRFWPAFSRSVEALDPVSLTSFQSWRILGMMFLFLVPFGLLPPVFAIPAGVGDVLVGLAAPGIVDRMRRRALGRWTFATFTAFGLLDFVVVFGFGNYVNLSSGPEAGFASMTALPLVLVPGFFVPAFAVLHLAAWVVWRRSAVARRPSVARPMQRAA